MSRILLPILCKNDKWLVVVFFFFLEPLSSDLGSLHGLPGNHSPPISARTSHVATVLRQLLELVDKHWNGSGSLLLNKKFLSKWMHSQLLKKGQNLASALCSYKSHSAPLTRKEKIVCMIIKICQWHSNWQICIFLIVVFPVYQYSSLMYQLFYTFCDFFLLVFG